MSSTTKKTSKFDIGSTSTWIHRHVDATSRVFPARSPTVWSGPRSTRWSRNVGHGSSLATSHLRLPLMLGSSGRLGTVKPSQVQALGWRELSSAPPKILHWSHGKWTKYRGFAMNMLIFHSYWLMLQDVKGIFGCPYSDKLPVWSFSICKSYLGWL